jgi:hypothetical protein
MERFEFDPDFDWTPEDAIELAYNETVLRMHWTDTVVYKYTLGDEKYDHVEHLGEDGAIYQFFLDDPSLRNELEKHGYPETTSPFVEEEVMAARQRLDINVETSEFAAQLEWLTPEDFS